MFIEDTDDNTTEDISKETIEEISKEMEDCINQKMRAIADYQNLKRRVDEERKERQRRITVDVVGSVLPVLDDIERAISSNSDMQNEQKTTIKQEKWIEGILLIKEKFLNILEEEGVVEIDTKIDFDPSLHEAIGHVDGKENKILEVIQKGFCMDELIVRPAKVIVGQKKKI